MYLDKCCKNCIHCSESSYRYYCENDDANIGGDWGVNPDSCCDYYDDDDTLREKRLADILKEDAQANVTFDEDKSFAPGEIKTGMIVARYLKTKLGITLSRLDANKIGFDVLTYLEGGAA